MPTCLTFQVGQFYRLANRNGKFLVSEIWDRKAPLAVSLWIGGLTSKYSVYFLLIFWYVCSVKTCTTDPNLLSLRLSIFSPCSWVSESNLNCPDILNDFLVKNNKPDYKSAVCGQLPTLIDLWAKCKTPDIQIKNFFLELADDFTTPVGDRLVGRQIHKLKIVSFLSPSMPTPNSLRIFIKLHTSYSEIYMK